MTCAPLICLLAAVAFGACLGWRRRRARQRHEREMAAYREEAEHQERVRRAEGGQDE